MIFEFTAAPGFDFITMFGKQINAPVRGDFLEIPKDVGKGYVRKISFGDNFKLTIHRYTLNDDLIIKRNPEEGLIAYALLYKKMMLLSYYPQMTYVPKFVFLPEVIFIIW